MKYTIKTEDMVQDFLDYNYKVKIVFYNNKKVEIYPLSYKIDEDDKKIVDIVEIPNIEDYLVIKRLKVHEAIKNEIMMKKSNQVEVTFKWNTNYQEHTITGD